MNKWNLQQLVIAILSVTAVVGWWTVCCIVAAMTPAEAESVAQRFLPLLRSGHWFVGVWVVVLHFVASGLTGLELGRWLGKQQP